MCGKKIVIYENELNRYDSQSFKHSFQIISIINVETSQLLKLNSKITFYLLFYDASLIQFLYIQLAFYNRVYRYIFCFLHAAIWQHVRHDCIHDCNHDLNKSSRTSTYLITDAS